jgi:uncharacterized protein YajQ (UPF0234 family)
MSKLINFNYITKIKLNNIKNIVNKLSKKEWKSFDFRQKTFDVHKHTETIPIIFNEDFRETDLYYWPCYQKFKNLLKKIENILLKYFSKGYVVRAILVKLKAKSKIDPHIDTGFSLEKCKRIHIPIISNSKTFFTVGEETKNLKEGEMWEINNSGKTHSVENNDNKDRVHLIVDWNND